jgi:hypothetical protein
MARFRFALSLALLGGLVSVAVAQDARNGIRVQFVTLHSAGGLQGEAFLPVSGRRVELRDRPAGGPCASGPELAFEGQHPSAYVRSVRISLRGSGDAHPIEGSACPAATMRVTLEDGTVLTGGGGSVRITSRTEAEMRGTFDWTTRAGGEPFPIKGEFSLKLPAGR